MGSSTLQRRGRCCGGSAQHHVAEPGFANVGASETEGVGAAGVWKVLGFRT